MGKNGWPGEFQVEPPSKITFSVDETVRQRLEFKVGVMADALEDSGLNIAPVPMDPDNEDDDFGAGGLDEGDVRALIAARARGSRDAFLSEIGRRGERLTVNHEAARTGRCPKWVALDSSAEGYDVLSRMSSANYRRLTIEVKASERPLSSAAFHLTRNEWETALESLNHVFHLWVISAPIPMIAVLSVEQVSGHIPADSGNGYWESVSIPFREFSSLFS